MQSKKINILKLTILIGSSLIVLFTIAYSLAGEVKHLPEKAEIINNDTMVIEETLIASVKMHVSLRDSIVAFGMQLLGTPYADGACGIDGFDCSGFVYFVFLHYKIQVPRSSSQFKDFGKEIPIDKVKKGDILVFLSPTRNVIGHVGIVTNPAGMETEFIHSSSGSEMKVIISSLKQEGYKRRFVKAVDVLGNL